MLTTSYGISTGFICNRSEELFGEESNLITLLMVTFTRSSKELDFTDPVLGEFKTNISRYDLPVGRYISPLQQSVIDFNHKNAYRTELRDHYGFLCTVKISR